VELKLGTKKKLDMLSKSPLGDLGANV
jgi:hypothetical protein